MTLKHVVLAALLAFVGCKKTQEDVPSSAEHSRVQIDNGGEKSGDSKAGAGGATAGAGAAQKGPGFTVNAPNAPTTSKAKLADDQPEDDVYTFMSAGKDRYEVRVHPVRSDQDGLQAATLVRDKIVFTAEVKLSEDDIAEGALKGFDLSYRYVEDEEHLFMRSQIVSDGKSVFHVRAVWKKKDGEAAANAFVDSFALSN